MLHELLEEARTHRTARTGIYQESIALLERGCLEQLIETVADRIEKLL